MDFLRILYPTQQWNCFVDSCGTWDIVCKFHFNTTCICFYGCKLRFLHFRIYVKVISFFECVCCGKSRGSFWKSLCSSMWNCMFVFLLIRSFQIASAIVPVSSAMMQLITSQCAFWTDTGVDVFSIFTIFVVNWLLWRRKKAKNFQFFIKRHIRQYFKLWRNGQGACWLGTMECG